MIKEIAIGYFIGKVAYSIFCGIIKGIVDVFKRAKP